MKPKQYRELLVTPELHLELDQMRVELSLEFLHTPKRISLSSTIRLLIEHARKVPPDTDWLRTKVAEMPKRGRAPVKEHVDPRMKPTPPMNVY